MIRLLFSLILYFLLIITALVQKP